MMSIVQEPSVTARVRSALRRREAMLTEWASEDREIAARCATTRAKSRQLRKEEAEE